MTNGEKIKVILKPRTDQIRIYGDWVEIEIQSLGINFSCELSWWNAEYKEPTHITDVSEKIDCEHTDCNNCVNHKYCDYEPTTKNDLGVDCISRVDAIKAMQDKAKKLKNEDTINGLCGAVAILFDLPSVRPQEPQTFKWCTDCKEYDQEKHCCHRWSKVIRDTVEEMKQEQEPILDRISSLRFNEPMQVDLEGDGYADGELVYDYGKCPKCGWDFEEGDKDWKEPYCCHCGQKLKWFDNESESEVEDGNVD